MASRSEGAFLSLDAIDRVFRVVRAVENQLQGSQESVNPPVPTEFGVHHVIITGPRRAIRGANDPIPTSSTTSSTTSVTGTTAPPVVVGSTSTTTTTTFSRMAYTGYFLYRNHIPVEGEPDWMVGETCYVEELNNRTLGIGCRYAGRLVGLSVDGEAIVAVGNQGQVLPCGSATTSTTTTSSCGGVCQWERNEGSGLWELIDNACGEGCNCPHPDFCPPAGECAETKTYCFPNFVDPDQNFLCTTTTTGTGTTASTSATSATTTPTSTTRDPSDCGSGCIYKLVPGVGLFKYSDDCIVGGDSWFLPDGTECVCGGCGGVPDGTTFNPCLEIPAPCVVSCTPPPPPPTCAGLCKFIWPDIPGLWWLQVTDDPAYRCASNRIDYSCVCNSPTEPGTVCLQEVITPCYHPVPPTSATTSGTGTTTATTPTSATTATTSTTRGNCGGWCVKRWNSITEIWEVETDCGASCQCSDVSYPGETDCDVAKVPCQTTTTSATSSTSTTSTSSTTSTTTTTTPCGPYHCTYTCIDSGGSVFVWDLTDPCPIGCGCSSPDFECTADLEDIIQDMPCGQFCDCDPPSSSNGTCCWQCLADKINKHYWGLLCASGCPVGYNCFPPPYMPLCTDANAGDVFYATCSADRETTSATTSTTTTSNNCGGIMCRWLCFGGATWDTAGCIGNTACGCFEPPYLPGGGCTDGITMFTDCYAPDLP